MQLPLRLTLPQTQTQWASLLNPILSNPLLQGRLLTDVSLINGTTQVNHGLQRNWQGWFVTNIDGVASLHVVPNSNQTPKLTIPITSSAAVTVSLWVF